jgi:hypothetical protein
LRRRTDPAAQEDGRRAVHAGAHDEAARLEPEPLAARVHDRRHRAAAIELNALGERVAHDLEARASAGLVEVGECRVPGVPETMFTVLWPTAVAT